MPRAGPDPFGIPPVKLGTWAERDKARHAAARLVIRNNGTAVDLRLLLDSLALWPANDPQ